MKPSFVYAETETLAFTAEVVDTFLIRGEWHHKLRVLFPVYMSDRYSSTKATLCQGDTITLPTIDCRPIRGKLALREWDMAKTMRDAQARADDPGWTCEHSGLVFLAACAIVIFVLLAFPSLTH